MTQAINYTVYLVFMVMVIALPYLTDHLVDTMNPELFIWSEQ